MDEKARARWLDETAAFLGDYTTIRCERCEDVLYFFDHLPKAVAEVRAERAGWDIRTAGGIYCPRCARQVRATWELSLERMAMKTTFDYRPLGPTIRCSICDAEVEGMPGQRVADVRRSAISLGWLANGRRCGDCR